ncbi:MAG: histone deacetylase [Planctomycetia bacterium]|nr:histone deacetylase [Planctomycetia bacterium]
MPDSLPPLLFSDPVFLEHETGAHPESPERLRHLGEYLKTHPVAQKFQPGSFSPAQPAQLELVHTPAHVDTVRRFAAAGGGRIESDTVMSPKSYDVACHAAGAALAAVDAVLAGQACRALCLVRPPGHHALPHTPMGFCLFNNVAIAAAHALKTHGLNRILIVDWDVHHGNGTQDTFYESESVFFFSVHRYPFYPGTGAAHETGTRQGLGSTLNLPLRFGIERHSYLESFHTALNQAASRARPDLVLVSAGFDAHAADPIGSLRLETEDFAPLTKLVCEAADQHCQGRLVSLLEGGYNVSALAESVACHMEGLS